MLLTRGVCTVNYSPFEWKEFLPNVRLRGMEQRGNHQSMAYVGVTHMVERCEDVHRVHTIIFIYSIGGIWAFLFTRSQPSFKPKNQQIKDDHALSMR